MKDWRFKIYLTINHTKINILKENAPYDILNKK